jgi:hypothetical protein
MRRYLYLLSPVLLLLMAGSAVAQTLTAPNPPPAPQAAWEMLLKLAIPIVITGASPYLQGWITSNFAKVHPSIQYMISSLLGLAMGAIAGQIPDFPLTSESAANMGAGAGLTGQFLANQSHADLHPKTESAKVVIAAMEQQKPGSSV